MAIPTDQQAYSTAGKFDFTPVAAAEIDALETGSSNSFM
jgi:hypothetical protein